MKLIKILTLFLLVNFISCQPPQSTLLEVSEETKQAIETEVASLTDVQSQKIFLENIHDLDQKIRHDQSDIEDKFGYDSEEAKKGTFNLIKTDKENTEKIEQFLTRYGHPTINQHGKKAAGTPWLVIHHSPDGINVRKRNFKYIYQAYKDGNIDEGALTFYMNRWYDIKFKKRIEWTRPFKIQEEIDTLIQSLEVQDIVFEIDKNLKDKP